MAKRPRLINPLFEMIAVILLKDGDIEYMGLQNLTEMQRTIIRAANGERSGVARRHALIILQVISGCHVQDLSDNEKIALEYQLTRDQWILLPKFPSYPCRAVIIIE